MTYRRMLTYRFLLLCIILTLNTGVATNEIKAQGTATPTPSFGVNPLSLIPGWDSLSLGTTSWTSGQSVMAAHNFTVLSPIKGSDGRTDIFPVLINQLGNNIGLLDRPTNISGQVFVLNDLVIGTSLDFTATAPNFQLTTLDWSIVDPKVLLSAYGTPDSFWVLIAVSGGYPSARLIMQWNNIGLVVTYTLQFPPNNLDVFRICASKEATYEATIQVMAPSSVILFPAITYEQPFDPTMFTQINDLSTLRQVLLRDECLQTSIQKWSQIDLTETTRLPAPTFTPTLTRISTATSTVTPTSVPIPSP